MNRAGTVVSLFLCWVFPLGLSAQAPPDFVQAARARDEAIDKVDIATWERLTATNFTVVNDIGRFLTRAERIAEFKNAKPAASPSVCGQEQIVLFANGAAATRRCLTAGSWWLEVWVKSASGWQAVAVQGTPAAK